MTNYPIAPQAHRPNSHAQASHMMHTYSHSPLARSTTDLSEVTHEYEPDVDADGFRHPGNHHAELPGEYSPGSSLRPQSRSNQAKSVPKAGKFFHTRPSINEDSSRGSSFTFEHEPDVDGEGIRHPHENLASPAARALQDVVVPLDPRAGRIVITPSPSIKPNYSPYKHNDDIPNRSIDDLQDPEELHSHANMIYGINEASASQFSVPDWQEGEAAMFIEEASHGELHPPTVPERPVAKNLPIEPTGKVMAPLGNISGDTAPVGPTRNMKESEMPGIDGAYTVDGEGSAGLPFDGNPGETVKEGDIEVQDESSVVPADMSASTETIRQRRLSSFADNIAQPQKPRLSTPAPVEDVKLPGKASLDQDGNAMEVPEDAKDERPEWLRAAEMMANNDYEKLSKEHLVTDERASNEAIDFASAARATLMRDMKIERGSSYPSFQEMEAADNANTSGDASNENEDVPRQGVSDLPEKNLAGANPPAGSKARDEKFAVEDETVHLKAKDEVQPDTAEKFLGLSAAAAVGASVPAAALMTSGRDEKSHTDREKSIVDLAPSDSKPSIPKRPVRKTTENESSSSAGAAAAAPPSIPQRPQKQIPEETTAKAAEKTAPAVPKRPASTTAKKDTPSIPARPTRKDTATKEPEIRAPVPIKPSIPARPVVGKLGGAKSAFASALEAKLKSGPTAPKKKEEISEDKQETASDEPTKPLADARKGRARGPQKRKPATIPAAAEEEKTDGTASKDEDTLLPSPVCEKGDFFTSRFGVEMRSMSVQTGVIRIKSPERNVTVMEGAGTDYVGQTVVVDDHQNEQHAISKEEKTLHVDANTSEPPPEQIKETKRAEREAESDASNSLQVPTVSLKEAAGGEIKSLEKNDMHPEGENDASIEAIKDELEVEA